MKGIYRSIPRIVPYSFFYIIINYAVVLYVAANLIMHHVFTRLSANGLGLYSDAVSQ